MRFLSTIVASLLGTLIALGLIFFFGLALIVAIGSSSDDAPRVRPSSVLSMPLSGAYVDQIEMPLFPGSGSTDVALSDMVQAIHAASEDDRIEAIWLRPEGVSSSWASLQEIRQALQSFSDSGKPIIASSGTNGFGEQDYFLASVADSVFSVPEGYFEWNGFSVQSTFYSEAMKKWGIEPQVVRAGKFKSAVEPYLRSDFSDENRAQLQTIVDAIGNTFRGAVAESRGLSEAMLEKIANETSVIRSREALSHGLVDGLLYKEDVEDLLKDRLNLDDDDLRSVSFSSYARTAEDRYSGEEGEVAVLFAAGSIMSGSSRTGVQGQTLGSSSFVSNLKRLREDEDVDAVVLRIDSPGGSATASDVMWNEVKRTDEVKPVIVSMGSMAASGGYYIAAPARRIVADPLTLTGSIGVFGLFFNVAPFLEERIGVTFDEVSTSPFADMYSGVRPITAIERARLEESTDQTYDTFLARVAEGRGMSPDQVHEIAQGRVWMGQDAIGAGLVDELGTLSDAIRIAAERAGLAEGTFNVITRPGPASPFDRFSDLMSGQVRAALGTNRLQEEWVKMSGLADNLLEQHGTVQARLPFEVTVR